MKYPDYRWTEEIAQMLTHLERKYGWANKKIVNIVKESISPKSDHSPLGINEAVSPSSLASWRSSYNGKVRNGNKRNSFDSQP